jgi:methylenetetrahydrofolate--tRNA-(uracil-5-)-methyltransferase
MIPGLERAEFLRYGSLHRNTFINAPLLWEKRFNSESIPGFYLPVRSLVWKAIWSPPQWVGWPASMRYGFFEESRNFPAPTTAHGALLKYLTESSSTNFQPMNTNFGLLPPPEHPVRERDLVVKK